MKYFLVKIVYVITPLMIFVIIVNYIIDPANLFKHGEYEKGMAYYLCNGFNLTNIGNFDGRLFQKYSLDCIKEKPDILVLGSSRSHQINSVNTGNTNLRNCCVSNGSLEDYLAIYNMYENYRFVPKIIIIGMDPWILNENNKFEMWRSIDADYYEMLRKLDLHDFMNMGFDLDKYKTNFIRIKQLVSFSYFQKSVSSIFDDEYFPTKDVVNEGLTILTDGSVYYSKLYREQSKVRIEKNIIKTIIELDAFETLSKKKQEILELFVNYLIVKKINLIFFLPPFHPNYYDFLSSNPKQKAYLDAENYFRNLAKYFNIPVMGSFDPELVGFDKNDFYDGFHCKESKIISLISIEVLKNKLH